MRVQLLSVARSVSVFLRMHLIVFLSLSPSQRFSTSIWPLPCLTVLRFCVYVFGHVSLCHSLILSPFLCMQLVVFLSLSPSRLFSTSIWALPCLTLLHFSVCSWSCLSLSQFSRSLAMQEVAQSRNYISFSLPFDVVSKPVMEQKLIRSIPFLKLSFLATQEDIKHSVFLLHRGYISFYEFYFSSV